MSKGRAIAFVVLTALLTAAAAWRPRADGPSPCMSKNLLGLSCPGCGMTRSVTAAAHGDIVAALRWHALGPVLLVATLAAWVLIGAGLVAGKDYLPDLNRPVWTWSVVGFFVALVVYWLIRLGTGTTP